MQKCASSQLSTYTLKKNSQNTENWLEIVICSLLDDLLLPLKANHEDSFWTLLIYIAMTIALKAEIPKQLKSDSTIFLSSQRLPTISGKLHDQTCR